MKRSLLLLILACLFLGAQAQRHTQGQLFLKDKCQPLYLASPLSREMKRPPSLAVRELEVVDFRPDTSRLGFLTENRKWKDIRFRAGFRQELNAYLNEAYAHPGGTQSLLIIVKKCWLFDTVLARPNLELQKQAGKGRVIFRAEVFLKTNTGLAPYAYLDTVVTSAASVINIANRKLSLLLKLLMNKVAGVEETAVLKNKRYYSFEALDSLNKRRFTYPMDTAQVLRMGVYASLEEFRNNQPSILDYQVQPNNEGHLDLFLKDETGNLYLSRKMWGYCDGEYCYVMMDGSLFPIMPVDHAFYVVGSREYKLKQTKVPYFAVIPGAYLFGLEAVKETVTRKLSLFHLDAHTGQVN